jgi:hypothetical protein
MTLSSTRHAEDADNMFAVLRRHFKKNRSQLEALWPKETWVPSLTLLLGFKKTLGR